MVIIYNYGMQNQRRQQTNAPHLLAILMAMAICGYDTKHINQCVVHRASIEATELRNWLNICSVLPRKLTGSQVNKHFFQFQDRATII